ncbi:amidase domain-containing protein [Paenibacillus sp. S33]
MQEPMLTNGGMTVIQLTLITTFVSQALNAGGMLQWSGLYLTGDDAWYFKDNFLSKPSHSWGRAHNFYNHWKYRAKLASSTNDMSMGDPVNADFNNDGDIDHTAIITEFTNGHFF